MKPEIDPKLDLVLERSVEVSPEKVWKAWTTPELIKKWFTPVPYKTVDCRIELRPGGLFHTVMESPEGKRYPNDGCYLEVQENRKLVWTDALLAGFRPAARHAFGPKEIGFFTATILMEPEGKGGCRYTAIAQHADESGRKNHEEMGFHDGWGTVLTQLVELMKKG